MLDESVVALRWETLQAEWRRRFFWRSVTWVAVSILIVWGSLVAFRHTGPYIAIGVVDALLVAAYSVFEECCDLYRYHERLVDDRIRDRVEHSWQTSMRKRLTVVAVFGTGAFWINGGFGYATSTVFWQSMNSGLAVALILRLIARSRLHRRLRNNRNLATNS